MSDITNDNSSVDYSVAWPYLENLANLIPKLKKLDKEILDVFHRCLVKCTDDLEKVKRLKENFCKEVSPLFNMSEDDLDKVIPVFESIKKVTNYVDKLKKGCKEFKSSKVASSEIINKVKLEIANHLYPKEAGNCSNMYEKDLQKIKHLIDNLNDLIEEDEKMFNDLKDKFNKLNNNNIGYQQALKDAITLVEKKKKILRLISFLFNAASLFAFSRGIFEVGKYVLKKIFKNNAEEISFLTMVKSQKSLWSIFLIGSLCHLTNPFNCLIKPLYKNLFIEQYRQLFDKLGVKK